MDGHQYEHECAKSLKRKGFSRVEVTRGSGDQGIDIIAYKGGKKYGIQCKYYSSPVGNKAVQEAYAGAKYYNCDVSAVMTNTTFTKSAISLSKSTGVVLWNGNDFKAPGGKSVSGARSPSRSSLEDDSVFSIIVSFILTILFAIIIFYIGLKVLKTSKLGIILLLTAIYMIFASKKFLKALKQKRFEKRAVGLFFRTCSNIPKDLRFKDCIKLFHDINEILKSIGAPIMTDFTPQIEEKPLSINFVFIHYANEKTLRIPCYKSGNQEWNIVLVSDVNAKVLYWQKDYEELYSDLCDFSTGDIKMHANCRISDYKSIYK